MLLTRASLPASGESDVPAANAGVIPARTELPEMVTDRPDFTESTDVVGKGMLQIENGFTVERSQGAGKMTSPELLMRVGLSKRVELRLGGDGLVTQRIPGKSMVVGYSDFEIAAKVVILEAGHRRPAISLIPLISAPAGSPFFSSGAWDPTLKIAIGKDLPKGFSASGNVDFSSLTTPEGRFLQTAWSVSVDHPLGRGFGAYWEVFGFTPWDKGSSAARIADTGITRSAGRNAQVDIRAGKRLSHVGSNWFWGVGVAFRKPLRTGSHS